ncbi:L,D-transpeptidase family protein [Thaumasiovibrio subtropicus]|uniref:L,D-transpeptidase family protein n=1 Tax=Thaumasiovibrio subtropicus TaxID=1891207 RepID=UPI000B3633A6|nr:L,D-transpeptidase family protein [Thaumasiovibrio subtropicus]
MWCSLLLLASSVSVATEYNLPIEGRLIGKLETYQPTGEESMADIADKFHVGILALLEANKGSDPYLPREEDLLTIPTQMLLPDVAREGVVVNLAELRLYYFPPDTETVHVFPIGIGRIGRETPEMVTHITSLIEHPTWTPTANIRKEYLEKHDIVLPDVVPAGPENPLGDHALRLAAGNGEYLIHGTNKTYGIGMRVSSGCIRMLPPDIEWLFGEVQRRTKVTVINQPLKASLEPDGSLYMEVHQPLSANEDEQHIYKRIPPPEVIVQYLGDDRRGLAMMNAALRLQAGVPVEIVGEVF